MPACSGSNSPVPGRHAVRGRSPPSSQNRLCSQSAGDCQRATRRKSPRSGRAPASAAWPARTRRAACSPSARGNPSRTFRAQARGVLAATGIGPGVDRRERLAPRVAAEQTVPETGHAHGVTGRRPARGTVRSQAVEQTRFQRRQDRVPRRRRREWVTACGCCARLPGTRPQAVEQARCGPRKCRCRWPGSAVRGWAGMLRLE